MAVKHLGYWRWAVSCSVLMLVAGCAESPPIRQTSTAPQVSAPDNTPQSLGTRIVRVPTRANVTQRFLLIPAQGKPKALLLLLPGDDGRLRLKNPSTVRRLKGDFLVRTKEAFARAGYVVALLDAPSDQQGAGGMRGGFRVSSTHAQDLEAVIRYLHAAFDVPVWIVGTGRGTESAMRTTIEQSRRVRGAVLSSTTSVSSDAGSAVTELPLHKIRVPVLLLAHRNDSCRVSPPDDVQRVAQALRNAKTVEIEILSSADRPKANPCEGRSPHGFFGAENEAVATIVQFIDKHN